MKLSTRSRYGTRMMLDLAEHHDTGPVRKKEIAERQDISGNTSITRGNPPGSRPPPD
ncbi:MAG: Rrf2 family transcriptional regulator [Deltaproteobacteria bacterium]|nr:Rrf2 family transcriptional regulator [Deltaproteobacteria bacterium]